MRSEFFAIGALVIGTTLVAGCQSVTADTEAEPEVVESPIVPKVPGAASPGDTEEPHNDEQPAIEIERDEAPDFTLTTLDGSGAIRLSDFRGKVVVLSFWGID